MNARKHHYQFAYQHIPNNLWTQAGRRMTARLLTDEALAVIRFYWRQTGDELPPEARLSPDGLSCTLHDAGHGLAVLLVQMRAVGAVVVLMVTGSSGVLVAVASPPRFLAVKARMCR